MGKRRKKTVKARSGTPGSRPAGDGRQPSQPVERDIGFRLRPQWLLVLAGIFVTAFGLRLYGGMTFGFGMDGPGTFSMINYDEGGSCRSVLSDFSYPRFVGHQVLAAAGLFGKGPSAEVIGAARAKSYCHSQTLIRLQRAYSAFTGALTVVLVGAMALMMWPRLPRIAWTACALLGLSNLHVAHSHWGTVDSPQVFFVTLLMTALVYHVVSGRAWPLLLSPLLLVAAIWTKEFVFAIFAYAFVLPRLQLKRFWPWYVAGLLLALLAGTLAIGWGTIADFVRDHAWLLWGHQSGKFGTNYGHIGIWRRLIRNVTNLPIVHIVGLGLPASFALCFGISRAIRDRSSWTVWLVHAPAAVYAFYLLLIAPRTYYRDYLLLFPTAALLAAYGFWQSRWSKRRLLVAIFLLYPLLLTLDSEYNYRSDPRRELRQWYTQHEEPKVLISYYVMPPSRARAQLFSMDRYLEHGTRYLEQADYLILSENWYDTAFPNELNGPIAWRPEWLIKTRAVYAQTYREILSGRVPDLTLDAELSLTHFTPEFLLHRFFYGSFQLFVGDLRIFRIQPTVPLDGDR